MTEHGGHPPLSHIWSSDQSLYARVRQMMAHPSSVKLIKYAGVSVISTIVSQVTLFLVFGVFHLMSEVPANILANVLATVPSYALNRRWVWGKSGKSHFWKEVAPFWILSFVGLAFSSLAVWLAGDFARSHGLQPRGHRAPGEPGQPGELRHPVDREVRDLQQALPRRARSSTRSTTPRRWRPASTRPTTEPGPAGPAWKR